MTTSIGTSLERLTHKAIVRSKSPGAVLTKYFILQVAGHLKDAKSSQLIVSF